MIDFESKRSGNAYYHTIDIHNLNFGQHTHRSYEMIFIKAGILKVTIENTEYIIKPNYAIIISPYQIHSFETIEYNDVFSCIYSPICYRIFMIRLRTLTLKVLFFFYAQRFKYTE